MNFRSLLRLLIPIIIEIINGLQAREECPDGVCPPVKMELTELATDLDTPTTYSAGLDFWKCIDYDGLFTAVKAIIVIVRNALAGVCPDDEKKVG
jgi:hypothetical protein